MFTNDDPPEPGAWRGEDRSRENSEAGFLSEMGRVPASEAEADWDTGPARSEPGLVDTRLVGYCGQICRHKMIKEKRGPISGIC